MGCNSCRSACEDCSEGGVTFRRAVRLVVSAARPAAVVGTESGNNLDGGRLVAELGSDPNSAQSFVYSERSFPELGSDPNSAGHWDNSSTVFSASSAHATSVDSYVIHNDRSSDSINGQRAVNRRMGVRAQFGDASSANPAVDGRIGIRPPFRYPVPDFGAAA